MPLESNTGPVDDEARISTELASLHDAAFGGRACSLSTRFVGDVVICLIDLPLLIVEQTLLDGGCGKESVRETRRQFEHSLSPSLTAVIEHTTGREVVGFFTDVQLDPPMTVDLFRLAPAAA